MEWISVCPEVDIGLGTPRPPIQLERDGEKGIRLVMPETGEDLTDRMARYAIERVDILREKRISGYVLKSKSPSCGMEGVLVYDGNGEASAAGTGMFAAVLKERMPHLPVEDEVRLEEADVRENFIVRIFAATRWLELEDAGFTLAGLTRFHAQHRNLVMSHDPIVCETLDRLLRDVENERMVLPESVGRYEREFKQALADTV